MLIARVLDAGAEPAGPRRVVLLVLRGASFEHVPAPLAGRAVPLLPIDGSVTAASMATLFTGATPDRHGLVGNVYREGFAGEERSAFEHRMLAEPLWEAAERQGRRVVTLNLRLPGYAHDGIVASRVQRPESAAGRHDADPPWFGRALDEAVGPPPGAADLGGLLEGTLPAAAFAEHAQRWALHRRADILHVLRHDPFDLLIVDENVVDALLHPFTGRDSLQVQRARELANETVAAVMRALPADTALVVVSPYGMAPVRAAVPLGRVLETAGVPVEGPAPRVRIAAYGPVAHLYLAPGVEGGSIERILRAARDEATGAALLDRVARRGDPTPPLFHADRGGDLVALARPGTVLSAGRGPVAPRFPGDHGHASQAPGARGFIFMQVPGRALHGPATVRDVDVAATVSRLLGIDPPRQSSGSVRLLGEAPRGGLPRR